MCRYVITSSADDRRFNCAAGPATSVAGGVDLRQLDRASGAAVVNVHRVRYGREHELGDALAERRV